MNYRHLQDSPDFCISILVDQVQIRTCFHHLQRSSHLADFSFVIHGAVRNPVTGPESLPSVFCRHRNKYCKVPWVFNTLHKEPSSFQPSPCPQIYLSKATIAKVRATVAKKERENRIMKHCKIMVRLTEFSGNVGA